MTTQELMNKVTELKELEAMATELNAEIEAIKDVLKQTMSEQNTEELTVGIHILRYTTVLSNRFDSTAFKQVMPEMYKAYTKQTTSKRFTVS